MENYHHIWLKWAKILHRWGAERLGYLFLSEFCGLNILLAQGIYLIEPLIPIPQVGENLRALCALMEDDSSRDYFLDLLSGQGRIVA